jgi:hypothetical protein
MDTRLTVLLLLLAACNSSGQAPVSTPTGPSGGTPPPNGSVASIGGCQVFPADNAWNRDVSADPVDPASSALLARMSPGSALHLDLGTTEERSSGSGRSRAAEPRRGAGGELSRARRR